MHSFDSDDIAISSNFQSYHSPFSLLENSFFKRTIGGPKQISITDTTQIYYPDSRAEEDQHNQQHSRPRPRSAPASAHPKKGVATRGNDYQNKPGIVSASQDGATLHATHTQALKKKIDFGELIKNFNDKSHLRFPFLKRKSVTAKIINNNVSGNFLLERRQKECKEDNELDEKIRHESDLMRREIESCVQEANLFSSYLNKRRTYQIATDDDLRKRGRATELLESNRSSNTAVMISYVLRTDASTGNSALLNLDVFFKDHSNLQRAVNKLTTVMPPGKTSFVVEATSGGTTTSSNNKQSSIITASSSSSSSNPMRHVPLRTHLPAAPSSLADISNVNGSDPQLNKSKSTTAIDSYGNGSGMSAPTDSGSAPTIADEQKSSGGDADNNNNSGVFAETGGVDDFQFMVPPPLITNPTSVSEEIQVLVGRKKHIQSCQLLLLEKVAAKSKTIEIQIAEIRNRGWNVTM